MFLKKQLNKETFLRRALLVNVLCFFFLLMTPSVHAQIDDYVPLAPLPGFETTAELNEGDGGPVANYFSAIYRLGVSVALVIAVVMLIYGGFQYMTSDSIGGKGNGRDTVTKAVIGIILAVSSYALLFLIGGPGSVRVGFELEPIEYTPPPPGSEQDRDPEEFCRVSVRTTTEPHNSYPRCPALGNINALTLGLPFFGELTDIWLSKEELVEYSARGGGNLSSFCQFFGYEHPLSIDMGDCEDVAASEGLFDPGNPEACFAETRRSADARENEYFCEVTPSNPQRRQVVFKLPTGPGADRSSELGACYQVNPLLVDDFGEDLCNEEEGREWDVIHGATTEPTWYCFEDATEAQCADLLAGKFRELQGQRDEDWDRFFCDLTEVDNLPPLVSGEQREAIKQLGAEFFDSLGLPGKTQTSGYYYDDDYRIRFGGEDGRRHTGIDIDSNGEAISAPVTGRVYIMRTPNGPAGYQQNGKIAIVERLPDGTERAWVFTHTDNFNKDLENGDIVNAGTEFARVGINPTAGSENFGTHLDLNVYTQPDIVNAIKQGRTDEEFYWSGLLSGRVANQASIAETTMCPFQAYWESINGHI